VNLFARLVYRIYRIFSGGRHWFQQRFTIAGLGILCALIATGMMGPDSEHNVAYQAFTLLLCLLVVAAAFSWWFRASFSANRLLPRFGTVGSPLYYSVVVRNLTSKNQNGLTLLEELVDPRPTFNDWRAAHLAQQKEFRSFRFSERRPAILFRHATVKEAEVPTVAPQEEVQVRLELTPLHRGLLRFEGLRLARPDPLGLFRAFCRLPLSQNTLILPRRYPLPALAFPGTLKYQDGGVALASNVGQSDEFVSLRDYRNGDPLRHIHWRTWAKAGKPVVKEFEDEFFVRHALVLDTFTENPYSEVFEEAVSVAASFACAIQTQESLLDLLFVGPQSYCCTSGRGLAHTDQMLEILASVRACSDHSFSTLEHLVLNHISAVSGCICVLLAWDNERRKFVEKLRTLGVPLLVLIIVGHNQALPLDPGPMQDEPHRFRVLRLGQIKEGLARLTNL
jgi:uncharacterized protein (DUF58 family)